MPLKIQRKGGDARAWWGQRYGIYGRYQGKDRMVLVKGRSFGVLDGRGAPCPTLMS